MKLFIHSQTSTVQPNRWSLAMGKLFHPTLYWACDYLSMRGLELIHLVKESQWPFTDNAKEI